MQPVRLLRLLQHPRQMQVSLLRHHVTKLTTSAFSPLSSVHNSAQGSLSYSFNRPANKVFPINSVLPNKSWPAFFHPQSQEIFTHSVCRNHHGTDRNLEENLAGNYLSDAAWAIRLANENGFLSWCRNCYLSTAVGVGMEAEGSTAFATLAYETVFLVAGMNLTVGTSIFIFNILKMRHQIGLSPVGAATFVGASFTHLLFWIFILLSYTGYIKGDPDAKNNSNK